MSADYADIKYFRIGKVDKHAHVVGMWEIKPDRLPFDYIKYCYDDKGRVIRFEKHEREFPKAPYRTYTYEGDSKSVKESEWFDRFGNLKGYHRYYCDDKGFMIKREETDPKGDLKYYIESKYDDYGRLIEEAWYNPDNTLDKKDCMYFDNPDIPGTTPSYEEKYNSKDELEGTFYYKWDDRQNLVQKAWHDKDGNLQSYYKYKFNDNDLLVWLGLYHEDDKIQLSYDYEYDEVGNKISEKLYDGNGNLRKHDKWPGVANK